MRIVLDTNVMLVCPSDRSTFHPIFMKLKQCELTLCLTQEILLEYEEVFINKMGEFVTDKYMHLIGSFPSVVYWRPYYSWNLITNDPDDNKFVDCAIAANAEYIITEDKHFDILHTIGFPQVVPISAMDFINEHLK